MTSDNERARDVELAGEVSETAEAPGRGPLSRVVSEAVVAAIPAEGETASAAEEAEPPRLLTRVVAEAIVAAIPAQGEAETGGGATEGGAGGEAGG